MQVVALYKKKKKNEFRCDKNHQNHKNYITNVTSTTSKFCCLIKGTEVL